MNSAETNKLQWKSNPLLAGKKQKTDFARTSWDQSKDRNFGAWAPESDANPKESLFHSPTEKSALREPVTNQSELADVGSSDVGQHPASDTDSGTAKPTPHQAHPAPEASTPAAPSELNEQQIRIAKQQGYVQGLKDGMAKTLLDLEADRSKEKNLIQTITKELESLQKDPFRLFEPLRKLALHIAEQLVRGELSASGEAVERLIKACVSDLSQHDSAITVSANPHDLERVRPLLKNNDPPLVLQPDTALTPGSVRVRFNDTLIEDLIENRLEGLARQLISEPEEWLKNASSLVGFKVETAEPSFTDLRKMAVEQPVDDVIEKETSRPAEDIESVGAPATAQVVQTATASSHGADEQAYL